MPSMFDIPPFDEMGNSRGTPVSTYYRLIHDHREVYMQQKYVFDGFSVINDNIPKICRQFDAYAHLWTGDRDKVLD